MFKLQIVAGNENFQFHYFAYIACDNILKATEIWPQNWIYLRAYTLFWLQGNLLVLKCGFKIFLLCDGQRNYAASIGYYDLKYVWLGVRLFSTQKAF